MLDELKRRKRGGVLKKYTLKTSLQIVWLWYRLVLNDIIREVRSKD